MCIYMEIASQVLLECLIVKTVLRNKVFFGTCSKFYNATSFAFSYLVASYYSRMRRYTPIIVISTVNNYG